MFVDISYVLSTGMKSDPNSRDTRHIVFDHMRKCVGVYEFIDRGKAPASPEPSPEPSPEQDEIASAGESSYIK